MKINIMIVDDEAAMEKLIRKIFRKENAEHEYCFSYFGNAEQAYQYIGISRNVDVILLDIKMPGRMDGLTLLEKIRKMNPLIKVIMISAYGDMKRSRLAIQHGAFDFLEKPIDAEDLKFVVKRAIDHIIESKKVAKLINQLDTIGYFVKNDIIDYFKTRTITHAMEDCRKEVASVLSAYIHEFTPRNLDMDPAQLIRQLNEYHTEITRAVDMYNGYIDKYLGESVLAVFTGEEHLQNAVHAALKMRSLLEDLNRVHQVNREPSFKTGISINAGEILIGNIGSTDPIRLNHTVLGYPVGLCFSLRKLAGAGEILVPKNSHTQTVLDSYPCQPHQTLHLPGADADEVEIYNIGK